MIVSHKYEFIFIRTRKTAGSSIEAALDSYLGPDDIITGSKLDGLERRNICPGFRAHSGWRQIIELVGPEVFWQYRRFAFERNPWDKCVSEWLFKLSMGFERSLYQSIRHHKVPVEWGKYAIEKYPICSVYKFEDLDDVWPRLCESLGLPAMNLGRLKVNPDRTHYRHYYRRGARRRVARLFKREIEHFGYKY